LNVDPWAFGQDFRGLWTQIRPNVEEAVGERIIATRPIVRPRDRLPDETLKLLLENPSSQPVAVLLCSPPAAPDRVADAMSRARAVKRVVNREASRPILEPCVEGTVDGLTYAVLEYCRPLSDRGWLFRLQRIVFVPSWIQWLREAMKSSLDDAQPQEVELKYIHPLQSIAAHGQFDASSRAAALRSIDRIATGAWKPRLTFAHNDLWRDNILMHRIRCPNPTDSRNNFHVIDWGSAHPRGHPIYDLMRLSLSLVIPNSVVREEINRHCQILLCEKQDIRGYLLASLGWQGQHLNHFPPDNYLAQARRCLGLLTKLAI
jgi:hypothetical protein